MRNLRVIASEWHGGQGTSLYAYACSGRIDSGLQPEIRRSYNRIPREQRPYKDARELRTLHRKIGEQIRFDNEEWSGNY